MDAVMVSHGGAPGVPAFTVLDTTTVHIQIRVPGLVDIHFFKHLSISPRYLVSMH